LVNWIRGRWAVRQMASGSQENRAALSGGGRRKAVVFVVLIG
jgi:hypothetical protein